MRASTTWTPTPPRSLGLARVDRQSRRLVRIPVIDPPEATVASYRTDLWVMVRVARRHLEQEVLPAYRRAIEAKLARADGSHDERRFDRLEGGLKKSVDGLFTKMKTALSDADIRAKARRAGRQTNDRHHTAFYENVSDAVGLDVSADEPFRDDLVSKWVRQNTSLIKSVRDLAVIGISQDVEAALRRGTRHEVLAKKWREQGIPLQFGTLEGRTKVIARDQINKLNGLLTEHRQRNIGVKRYTWRTNIDGRERPEHHELNGRVFSWDEPSSEGHPGHAVQCRCSAEAVLDLDDLFGAPNVTVRQPTTGEVVKPNGRPRKPRQAPRPSRKVSTKGLVVVDPSQLQEGDFVYVADGQVGRVTGVDAANNSASVNLGHGVAFSVGGRALGKLTAKRGTREWLGNLPEYDAFRTMRARDMIPNGQAVGRDEMQATYIRFVERHIDRYAEDKSVRTLIETRAVSAVAEVSDVVSQSGSVDGLLSLHPSEQSVFLGEAARLTRLANGPTKLHSIRKIANSRTDADMVVEGPNRGSMGLNPANLNPTKSAKELEKNRSQVEAGNVPWTVDGYLDNDPRNYLARVVRHEWGHAVHSDLATRALAGDAWAIAIISRWDAGAAKVSRATKRDLRGLAATKSGWGAVSRYGSTEDANAVGEIRSIPMRHYEGWAESFALASFLGVAALPKELRAAMRLALEVSE